ncbi:MAG: hypothetical protein WB709_00115 [Solirubrobacteraceae bacterium]
MLRIQMIGLAVVAVVMMSAVAASGAFAAHQWLINGAAIAAATKVHSLGLLLLEDSGTGTQLHCHGSAAGTVGPGAADLTQSITVELLGTNDKIPCTFDKAGLCKSNAAVTALAVNLPWKTEIVLVGTEIRDLLLSGGAGAPGWKVNCTNILGGGSEDICTEEAGKMATTALANVTAGVLATFDAKTVNASCTLGGKETGVVRGPVTTFSPSSTEKLTFD